MKEVVLIVLFLFLFKTPAYASNNILINEVQIEPEQSVEVINTSSESIDVSGWYIDDSGGSTFYTIPPATIIYPNTCLVLAANFNLNKSSPDTIRLFNNTANPLSPDANLIDSFSYQTNPGPGNSYFRLPDASDFWSSGPSTLGRFNGLGDSCIFIPLPSPTLHPTSAPTSIPTPTVVLPTATPTQSSFYSNIYISEVMVHPEPELPEWIELYNGNDYEVYLYDWYIDDQENQGSVAKKFSLVIPAKSFAILELNTAIFNNDGDTVRLLDTTKQLKDSFEYSTTISGKTLARLSWDDDFFCIQNPTKNNTNGSCISLAPLTIAPTKVPVPTLRPTIVSTKNIIATPREIKSSNNNSARSKPLHIKSSIPKTTNSTDKEEVLSVSTSSLETSSTAPLKKSISFLSVSYSLLSIASIILKLKITAIG